MDMRVDVFAGYQLLVATTRFRPQFTRQPPPCPLLRAIYRRAVVIGTQYPWVRSIYRRAAFTGARKFPDLSTSLRRGRSGGWLRMEMRVDVPTAYQLLVARSRGSAEFTRQPPPCLLIELPRTGWALC